MDLVLADLRRPSARRPSSPRRATPRPCRPCRRRRARARLPSRCSTRTWMPTRSGWNTPISWFGAPAGLVSGPRMLKIVRTPSSLAHRRRVLHRAVVVGREHEADAGLGDATAPPACGRQHDVGAERFEHVGAAGLRRHRAAAVLGDARAGRGGDEHRRRRDVERVRRVAAGADDVDQVLAVGHVDLGGELAHHLRRRGDLADRLLLDAQARR